MAEKAFEHIDIAFDTPPKIAVIEARFYEEISDNLYKGAQDVLKRANADITRIQVPGALEIPGAIRMVMNRFDAFLALGCVLRGATTHYEIVSGESARGLMDLTLRHTLIIGNGILTVENLDQAQERAKPDKMNKGGGAAQAVLKMLDLRKNMEKL